MTTFRDRVADVVGSTLTIPQYPRTRPSRPVAPAVGRARQQALFDAATDLAAQANAVLAARDGQVVMVVDGSCDGAGFDIRVGAAHSRIVTTVVGDRAFGRILGDGLDRDGARELAGPGELPRLLLLLVSSGYRDGRALTGTAA
jgi:hypothetical protein